MAAVRCGVAAEITEVVGTLEGKAPLGRDQRRCTRFRRKFVVEPVVVVDFRKVRRRERHRAAAGDGERAGAVDCVWREPREDRDRPAREGGRPAQPDALLGEPVYDRSLDGIRLRGLAVRHAGENGDGDSQRDCDRGAGACHGDGELTAASAFRLLAVLEALRAQLLARSASLIDAGASRYRSGRAVRKQAVAREPKW